jgi:hypothetical protein
MSLAKEINQKLDEILSLKEELKSMKEEVPKDATLINKDTGDKMSVDDAIDIAYGVIRRVKEDLDTITNSGKNVRNVFDNPYYVNDVMQDRQIRQEQIAKENVSNIEN